MKNNEDLVIGIYWKNRKINTREYIELVKDFFRSLDQYGIDSNNWQLIQENSKTNPININSLGFENNIFPTLQKSDNWYFERDGSRHTKISLESTSVTGFYSDFIYDSNGLIMNATINAGKYEEKLDAGLVFGGIIPNSVIINISSIENSEYIAYDFIKTLFLHLIKYWKPDIGWVISREFRKKVVSDGNIYIGWLNYFKNIHILTFVSRLVKTELIEEGGFITILTSEMHSSKDQQQLERAILVRDSLKQNGFQNWS